MLSNFFQPQILQPTRIIGNNSPSLIDKIFFNSIEHQTVSGNLITKISDHLRNCIFCRSINFKTNSENRGFYRDYSNFKLDSYIHDLRRSNLDEKLNSVQGADEQHNILHDILISNMQKHAPLKPVLRKLFKQRLKPWITKGILKSISNENKYYKKFLNTKNPIWYQKYKYYRDLINHLIRKSKTAIMPHIFKNFKTILRNFGVV